MEPIQYSAAQLQRAVLRAVELGNEKAAEDLARVMAVYYPEDMIAFKAMVNLGVLLTESEDGS